MYQYKGTIDRWIDGDTVDVAVDLGFSIAIKIRFRIFGINCPEKGVEGLS